ncbi:MAG: aldose 1-epimerase family protein [Clostridia bacterium]|nr:aldose 1-epimerase family protein [Clostridia bacterium]
MLHGIDNGILHVTVSETGAELQSIRTADGTEYLWQGDPAYWGDRALNLFPYVARLWQGCYEMDGQRYEMPIHGLAPYSRFTLAGRTESSLTLELRSSGETYAQYPRQFVFRVVYSLHGNCLKTVYQAENLDTRTMYFGLGGHPGFNVPLEAGRSFEAYRLRFGTDCGAVRVGFSEDCYVNGEDADFPLEGGCILPLRHDLFDNDAIVLRDMARSVTLEAPGSARAVTVTYPDMPYLGIWNMPHTDAPYVCIEPWLSLPSRRGEVTVFEKKEDLIRLAPGAVYENAWTIEIHG